MISTTFIIPKISCTSCTSLIQGELERSQLLSDSVKGISADAKSKTVTIVTAKEEHKRLSEVARSVIEGIGFSVESFVVVPVNECLDLTKPPDHPVPESTPRTPHLDPAKEKETATVVLLISGMSCASCAANIENCLKTLPGVSNGKVNFALKMAEISYHTNEVTQAEIMQRITRLGFSVKVRNGHMGSINDEVAEWRVRVITCAVVVTSWMISWLVIPKDSMIAPGVSTLGIIDLTLSAILQVKVATHFYSIAIQAIQRKILNMSVLISLGCILTYGSSVILFFYGFLVGVPQRVFFDTSIMLLFFSCTGKYAEMFARKSTGRSIESLMKLQPQNASRMEKNGAIIDVDVGDLSKGDIVIVKAGQIIPVDGVVFQGSSLVNESSLTGEPLPVLKKPDSRVFSGTLNGDQGVLQIQVSCDSKDFVLTQVCNAVAECQMAKPRIQQYADRISSIFIPAVILLAMLTFTFWFLYSTYASGMALHESFMKSLGYFISVVVVACPCALGLATPTAVMVGSGIAAEHGILIRNGDVFEIAHQLTTILLDKTGTLTEGRMTVDRFVSDCGDREDLVELVYSLELLSEHPIGEAICRYAEKESSHAREVTSVEVTMGRGITGKVGERRVSCGSLAFIKNEVTEDFSVPPTGEYCTAFVAVDCTFSGYFLLTDPIRPSANELVRGLETHYTIGILSGDSEGAVRHVATNLAIPLFHFNAMPEDKRIVVASMQRKGSVVAMLGDGVNDAAALAQADLGIAFAGGTDISREAASVIIMSTLPTTSTVNRRERRLVDLEKILFTLRLSTSVHNVIRQNFLWSIGYNAMMLPWACGAFSFFGTSSGVGRYLNGVQPVIGAAMMALSSLTVILNSISLRWRTSTSSSSLAPEKMGLLAEY